MHVVSARQQVQHWTIPLQSDVMALLSLERGHKRRRARRADEMTISNPIKEEDGGVTKWRERG